MEHQLLNPLLEVIAHERRGEPDDLSAANVAAFRLLTGPYLAYTDHRLVEIAPGEIRLAQQWRDELILRDTMTPFYEDELGYADEDEVERLSLFRVQARKMAGSYPRVLEGEVPEGVSRCADELLTLARKANPQAINRLLAPTAEQMSARRSIRIETTDDDQIGNVMREILGDFHDGSLKAYGIDYHQPPHYSERCLFFIARNDDEVCGLLKLSTHQGWSVGLNYVCVAPHFRQQGLSKRIFRAAIDYCEQNHKVLGRSSPGDFTQAHPEITVGYDRMLRESPVLHGYSDDPLFFVLANTVGQGEISEAGRQLLKQACDAALPDPQDRLAGIRRTRDTAVLMAQAQRLMEQVQQGGAPARQAGRKPGSGR